MRLSHGVVKALTLAAGGAVKQTRAPAETGGMSRISRANWLRITGVALGLMAAAPSARAGCDVAGFVKGIFGLKKRPPAVAGETFPETAVRRAEVRLAAPVKVLSAPEFSRRYAYDPSDLMKPQTELMFEQRTYRVTGYDPGGGWVTLEADAYRDIPLADLGVRHPKVGQVVRFGDWDYQVAAITGSKEPRVFLHEKEIRTVQFGTFELLQKESGVAPVRTDFAKTGVPRVGTDLIVSEPVATSTLYSWAESKSHSREKFVKHVGKTLGKRQEVRAYREDGSFRVFTRKNWDKFEPKKYERVVIREGDSPELVEAYAKREDGDWRAQVIEPSATITVSRPSGGKALTVIVPTALLGELDEIRSVLKLVPAATWDAGELIRLNRHAYYRGGARGTSSHAKFLGKEATGLMDLYQHSPNKLKSPISPYVILHEHGHNFAIWKWSSHTPPEGWVQAMMRDKRWPSRYAETEIDEDFAEAFELYLKSDAGLQDPMARKLFPHRFGYLDRLMEEAAEKASKR